MRSTRFAALSAGLLVLVALLVFAAPAAQAAEYRFVYISHGVEGNPFWSDVYAGFQDALDKYNAEGKMYRPTKNEADLEWQLRTWKSVLASNPDGIITTIPHPEMFDDVIQRAVDRGIPVIASNTDDPEGADGNARLSYIGQSLKESGYMMAKEAVTKAYHTDSNPDPDSLNVLVPVGAPGAVWAEQRKAGILQFLREYGVPEGNISTLDTTVDPSQMQSRVLGFLKGNPETNLMLSVHYPVGTYLAAKSLNKPKDEITIGGYDTIPTVLDGIEEGYIDFTVDQQPYLQGYLPVVEMVKMEEQGTRSWSVNTGMAVVYKEHLDLYR